MDEQINRIRAWLNHEKAGPYFFRFFITSRCNLKCKFCVYGVRKEEHRQEELEIEDFHKIIDEISALGARRVDILGGEPFLKGDRTIDIMKQIKTNGLSGSITTNTTLLDADKIKEIVKMEWDVIQVSLDSPKKEVFDYYRGHEGTFEKVMSALEHFKEWKEKLGNEYTSVVVASVLTNWNYKDIKDLAKLAFKEGANCFNVTPLFQDFPDVESFQLKDENNEELLGYLEETMAYVKEKELFSNLQSVYDNFEVIKQEDKFEKIKERREEKEMPICFEPWLTFKLDSGGWVSCCSSHSEEEINIKGKSVEEVWFSEHFNKIRGNMLRRTPIGSCKHCCYNVYSDNIEMYEEIRKKDPELFRD